MVTLAFAIILNVATQAIVQHAVLDSHFISLFNFPFK